MTQPLISIIIPCYNAAAYVGKAVDSALGQTYGNVEVIVVDDGSTDSSLEVIRSFGDRIRWDTGPHRGGGAARNRGLQMARGELIQFLDADDYLHPEKLARQLSVMGQFPDDMVFCDIQAVATEIPDLAVPHMPPYDGSDPVAFVLRRQLCTPTPIHRKDVLIAAGGFDESLPCAQEYDLHLRLVCRGTTVHHMPEVLCYWRQTRAGISRDLGRVYDQYPHILGRAYRMLEDAGTLTPARRKVFAETIAKAGRHYLRTDSRQKALACFAEAARMDSAGRGLGVYSPPARLSARLLGPVLTEKLSVRKRQGIRATLAHLLDRLFFPDIRFYLNPFKIYEYHAVRKATQFPPDSTVLDLGCGRGLQAFCLAKKVQRVVGLDPDEHLVEMARARAHSLPRPSRAEFICSTLDAAGFADNTFDRIVSYSVIEHIPDEQATLRACRRVLKPGGEMVFTTDTRKLADDPVIGPRHRSEHKVLRYSDEPSLRAALAGAGFEDIRVSYILKSRYALTAFRRAMDNRFKHGFLETHVKYGRLRWAEAFCPDGETGLALLARARKPAKA